MVGGPQSWELQCSLAVLGKSGAGEVQQRRTGQALGSSVRRGEEEEEREEEGERAVLLGQSKKRTRSSAGLGEEWRRAIFGRSVPFIFRPTTSDTSRPTG